MIAEEYGDILVVSLEGLRRHFNERTGPGGDMELPPNGIAWTVMSPYPKIAEALERATKSKGRHLGILMPQSDEVLRPGVQGPYDYGTVDKTAGSLRRLRFTITIFVRSLKLQVTDGLVALIPSWLEELTRSYSDNDTVRVETVRYMGMKPDYLVIEATAHLDYVSLTSQYNWKRLLQILVEGPDVDGDGNPDRWFTVDLS